VIIKKVINYYNFLVFNNKLLNLILGILYFFKTNLNFIYNKDKGIRVLIISENRKYIITVIMVKNLI
jgi:hypothetical protein